MSRGQFTIKQNVTQLVARPYHPLDACAPPLSMEHYQKTQKFKMSMLEYLVSFRAKCRAFNKDDIGKFIVMLWPIPYGFDKIYKVLPVPYVYKLVGIDDQGQYAVQEVDIKTCEPKSDVIVLDTDICFDFLSKEPKWAVLTELEGFDLENAFMPF